MPTIIELDRTETVIERVTTGTITALNPSGPGQIVLERIGTGEITVLDPRGQQDVIERVTLTGTPHLALDPTKAVRVLERPARGPQGPPGFAVVEDPLELEPVTKVLSLRTDEADGGVTTLDEDGRISTDALPPVAHHHVQGVASTLWTMHHGLHFTPNVTCRDSTGRTVEGEYQHEPGITYALFAGAVSGDADLS